MRKIVLMAVLAICCLAQKVNSQGTSIYNAIDAGTLAAGPGFTHTFSNVDYAIDPNWLAGDGVYYSFTLTTAGIVDISSCGSTFDSYLTVYDSDEYPIYSNDDNGPLCAGTKASIHIFLEAGTYFVQQNINSSLAPGTISTTISMSTIVNGADIQNAINAGSVTECLGGSFTSTRDNSPSNGFGNEIGQASDDIYYSFSIASASTVGISTTGSAIDTYLHLLDANGNVIFVNDNNGPLAAGSAASIQQLLAPGIYYIAVEGSGSSYGNIQIGITMVPTAPAPPGAFLSNAIDAGMISPGVPFGHSTLLTDCYGNDIGDYGNDIYYKFSIQVPSQVTLSNCYSMNTFTSMYLLNSSGGEITRAQYSGPVCSDFRASITYTLPAGTYYIAAENYAFPSLYVSTSITAAPIETCKPLVSVPSTDQNYLVTYTPKEPRENVELLSSATTCEVQQTIQYYDELGRPLQSIEVGGSADGTKDIVMPFTHDPLGIRDKKYLSYASSATTGSYRPNALTEVAGYYQSQPVGVSEAFNTPFSETIFEASALRRAKESGAPGLTWQPVANSTAGHTSKMDYLSNATDEVLLWTLNGSGASAAQSFLPGKLYKTIIRNENWTGGNAGTREEFKDLKGRTILEKVWQDENVPLKTYYLYDDYGNLRYVLPPAVSGTSFVDNDAVFNHFIFAYRYDGKHRVVEKKTPAKGWQHMVYNKLGQIVLTQDAIQRDAGKWQFIKYDAMGRVVITGIIGSSDTRPTWQANIDAQTVLYEQRDNANAGGSGTGYTNNTLPLTGLISNLTMNYYDDYSFLGNSFGAPSGTTEVDGEAVIGLMTGTKTNILGTTGFLLSVNYYDLKGRIIRGKGANHLNGTDETFNTYSFTGELVASKREHQTVISSVNTIVTIDDRHYYDHRGRKTATLERINSQPWVTVNKFEYGEVGQLIKKSLHSTDGGTTFLQNSTYNYNERGWLRNVNSSEFSMQLDYQQGSFPQYNGNISNQHWTTAGSSSKSFTYQYDKLNRLWKGEVSPTVLSEVVTYDGMGNITSMNRDNAGPMVYTYRNSNNSNQLDNVAGLSVASYDYDLNGNAKIDGRNGMSFTYNHLNLPETASNTSVSVSYTYSANGLKLRKSSSTIGVTDYVDDIQYSNGSIEFVKTEEGVARRSGSAYVYEYNLPDHLGNARYTFGTSGGTLNKLQTDDYYAFGKRNPLFVNPSDNKYLYNGKELQDELGEQYDYGARFYDPLVGRWNAIDPSSESYRGHSPYNYVANNPISKIDPDGRDPSEYMQRQIAKGYNDKFRELYLLSGQAGLQAQQDAQFRSFWRSYYNDVKEDSYETYMRRWNTSTGGGGNEIDVSSFGGLFQKVVGTLMMATPFGSIGAVANAGRQQNYAAGAFALLGFAGEMGAIASLGSRAASVAGRASDLAAASQTGRYAPDVWRDIRLTEGTFVAGGLPGQTNFYTTLGGLARSEFSSVKLWEGLQVAPSLTFGYRSEVGIYRVNSQTNAAFGITYNNPQFGTGGFPQVYIPDYSNLVRVNTIGLKK